MRTFCLLLILGNALFFSWAELIDVHVSNLDRSVAVNVAPSPRIVLAREATATPEPAAIQDMQPPQVEPLAPQAEPPNPSNATQVAKADVDTMSCTSVGPFADLADASHAQAALRTGGFSPRQRLEQGELWVGYWVSVQNLESREAAEAAMKTLSSSGIKDVYLMPGSDPANVLSLGVFSDYHRADRRAQEIRALGLEPRIDDRKRAGSVYWLDVDLPEPGKSIDTSLFQTDPGKIMRLELRACPPATPATG
jgi:hypothetical protein